MGKKEDTFIGIKHDFIDDRDNFLRVEKALLDIEKTKIYLRTEDGEGKPFKLNGDTIYIYILLTRSVFLKTDREPQAEVSIDRIVDRSGFTKPTIRRHFEKLEEAGLIEREENPGRKSIFHIKVLRDSNIFFDRKEIRDGKEVYAHEGIEKYIQFTQEQEQKVLDRVLGEMDHIMLAILGIFKVDRNSFDPKQRNELKQIKNSGIYTDGQLIDIAQEYATQKKDISYFIDNVGSEINKRRTSQGKQPIPFFNWLNDESNENNPFENIN